jgi:hypothetical protein
VKGGWLRGRRGGRGFAECGGGRGSTFRGRRGGASVLRDGGVGWTWGPARAVETGTGLGGGRCSGRMIAVAAVAVMEGEEVEGALREG